MNAQSMTKNIIADLSHWGLISATGAEAFAFLQGQLANDVSAVDARHSQLNCYLNAQGKVLTMMRLFQRDEAYCLLLPRQNLVPILARLRMYVMRAKVSFADVSDSLVRIGVGGPDVISALKDSLGALPENDDALVVANNIVVIRVAGLQPRFVLVGEASAIQTLRDQLTATCTPVDSAVWQLGEILAGMPTIYPETQEKFIPQMLNLDWLNAVSFRKGCYPGQEIVTRTRTRGNVQRRLFRCHTLSNDIFAPGTPIFSAGLDSEDEEAGMGTLIEAQAHPDGGQSVLAVIFLSALKSTLALGSSAGPKLEILAEDVAKI